MNVYSEIPQILSSLNIPVVAIQYPTPTNLPNAFIVFTIIDSPNKTVADGIVTGVSMRIQISYYTKDGTKLGIIPKQVEDLMINAGFMRIGEGNSNFFQDTRHYSHRQDFRYYERR